MSVPFKVDAVFTSFADMNGIARVVENALALEFQVKDNLFGIIKSAPREVHVAFTDLEEVTFKRGWFRGVLVVRARRMSALAEIPGHDGAEIRLSFSRRHRDAAQDLASQVSMRMVTQDLQRMVNETSRAAYPISSPPPAVPNDPSKRPLPPGQTGGLLQ